MNSEKITKLFQLIGAALALPVGAAGAYTVYKAHFSSDVACQNLRASIVTTMEKNVGADAKRALLKKDVAEFEKACGDIDPEARAIFVAAIDGHKAPDFSAAESAKSAGQNAGNQNAASQNAANQSVAASQGTGAPSAAPSMDAPPPVTASPATAPPATPSLMQPAVSASPPPSPSARPIPAPISAAVPVAPSAPVAQGAASAQAKPTLPAPAPSAAASSKSAAVSPPKQAQTSADDANRRGWLTLARRGVVAGRAEINFDGFAFGVQSFPPPGTILKARWAVPVWPDPSEAQRDVISARGVLKAGNCVRVISVRSGVGRLWGEVTPSGC